MYNVPYIVILCMPRARARAGPGPSTVLLVCWRKSAIMRQILDFLTEVELSRDPCDQVNNKKKHGLTKTQTVSS